MNILRTPIRPPKDVLTFLQAGQHKSNEVSTCKLQHLWSEITSRHEEEYCSQFKFIFFDKKAIFK